MPQPGEQHVHRNRELVVEAEKTRRADLVIYVNGVPLVVIEVRRPLAHRDKSARVRSDHSTKSEIPRLFSNAFWSSPTASTSL
ncbi:MAG: hypothetical protein H6509_15785 [Bryobacterales bacterium]|nr:hypothetical protein [Bryobacterales bacterium]